MFIKRKHNILLTTKIVVVIVKFAKQSVIKLMNKIDKIIICMSRLPQHSIAGSDLIYLPD